MSHQVLLSGSRFQPQLATTKHIIESTEVTSCNQPYFKTFSFSNHVAPKYEDDLQLGSQVINRLQIIYHWRKLKSILLLLSIFCLLFYCYIVFALPAKKYSPPSFTTTDDNCFDIFLAHNCSLLSPSGDVCK